MDPIRIRLGGYQGPASVHTRAARRFGEVLRRDLGTGVTFELIESVIDRGRSSGELPVMVEHGELDLCYISTVRYTPYVREFELLELPYVAADRIAVHAALDGALGARLRERLDANSPFRLLDFWDNGYRHLSNRVRPIRTPADCAGLRIRTQLSALHGEVFRALGFVPVPTDIKRFIEEIAGDVFDAQDNPLTNIYNFGIHRHQPHITLTGHLFGASGLICNAARFDGWPAEVRAAVIGAAREATVHQRMLAMAEDDAMLAKFAEEGVNVVHLTAVERNAFVEAVAPVLERHRKAFDPTLLAGLQGGKA